MESNVYQTPEADLNHQDSADGVLNFERFSAWGVFGLMIITLSYYGIYWLYKRSEVLNSFHSNKMSKSILVSFVLLVVFQILSGIGVSIVPDILALTILDGLINLAYIVLYLVVLFGFRKRLMELTGDKVNPVLTFFGSVIYLQYKINKSTDSLTSQQA